MTALISLLLRLFRGNLRMQGCVLEVGTLGTLRVVLSIDDSKLHMDFDRRSEFGLRDAAGHLHRIHAARVTDGKIEFAVEGYNHWFAATCPVRKADIKRIDSMVQKERFFTRGQLVLPSRMAFTVALDKDAVMTIFADPKPILDGPANYNYSITQAWFRTTGVHAEASGKHFKRTWQELGVA